MSKDVAPHFGGLWADAAPPKKKDSARLIMHFFGDKYFVILRFEKPNDVIHEMHHYVLSDGAMSRQLLDGTDDTPVIDLDWRWIDDRFLEFDVDGKKSLWEPTSTKQLAAEGFPVAVLESLRKRFVEAGEFYSEVPAIPDSSLFELMERKRR